MIERRPLCPLRVRKINGSFAFIEHRFLREGYFESLTQDELLLYLFLVLVSDRKGLSFYGYDKICTLLRFSVDEYLLARNVLIEKDLIAFDGHLFQVLSLPEKPKPTLSNPMEMEEEMSQKDPATIHQIILNSLGDNHG